jgi:hypothetical protein
MTESAGVTANVMVEVNNAIGDWDQVDERCEGHLQSLMNIMLRGACKACGACMIV